MKFKHALLAFSLIGTVFAQQVEIRRPASRKAAMVEEGDKTFATGASLGKAIYENLSSNGILKLNGTTVKQKLQVEGSLLTQDATLNSVEVRGEANFKNTFISQAIEAVGFLRAEQTIFQGPLILHGIKAVLIGSTLNAITVRKEGAFRGNQVLELKNKTTVDGPIIFESGRGEVHCYPGCKVFGTITGGKLVKKG